jgi:glucose/arabinose dehydrogenase
MALRSFLFVIVACLPPIVGRAELPRLHVKPLVLSQIDSPTVITHAADGSRRLFVCDQPGLIRIVRRGMLLPAPFLDLTATGLNRVLAGNTPTSYSERGLLGLAFHPDYADAGAPGEGRFYVYYSSPSATNQNPTTPQDHITVISEFRVSVTNPDLADPASERFLLTFGQPQSNHNGGQLAFGPDGMLYAGSGDGGGSNDNALGHTGTGESGPLGNALDRTKLLGKILRIDPLGTSGPGGNYGIPQDNPFVGEGGGVREEIYAYGLRNPWRFSFDMRPGGTGRLFCGDVGQGSVEEINLITSGGNFGWRYREGTFEFDGAMVGAGTAPVSTIDPIAQYAHPGVVIGSPALPQLGKSVTGGYVYRGSAIPDLGGVYLFADYSDSNGGGRLMALEETQTAPPSGVFDLVTAIPLTEANPFSDNRRILTLGEDEDGEIYIGTKTSGKVLDRPDGIPEGGIYQLVPAVSKTESFPADRDNSLFENSSNSNGAGPHLYSGRTGSSGGNTRRRALLRFDISPVPALTGVTAASVVLHQNLGGSAPVTMSLHRLTSDWGEAGSNAGTTGGQGAPAQTGDATWVNRIHPSTAWGSPGGDFILTPSAITVIDSTAPAGPVPRTWSGPGILADVQAWLASPASHFGWALIGDEVGTFTAQRFDSRESTAASGAQRPRLDLTYFGAPEPRPFESFLATHYPAEPIGTFRDPEGDEDGDEIPLILEHAYGFEPDDPNPAAETRLTLARSPLVGGATLLTITFRRNPLATDVNLALQIGSSPSAWTTVAQSLSGEAPTGENGGMVISDLEIAGEAPARLVTVEVTLPEGTPSRFARLEASLLP